VGRIVKRIQRNICEREGIYHPKNERAARSRRLRRLLTEARRRGIPDHITEAYVRSAFKRGGNW